MSGAAQVQTPLMQQYREIKARHQNAILFFRMGEFYEMFYDDAETAARVLGLTLTTRNNGGAADVPLAGVPAKAVNEYVRRLVQLGFRVAICEQIEDPKLARGSSCWKETGMQDGRSSIPCWPRPSTRPRTRMPSIGGPPSPRQRRMPRETTVA